MSTETEKPERLLDLGGGLAIWAIDLDDLAEQELNARAMSSAMFERLSATIGRDNRLESLPFVAMVDERFEIVSGHHRTRAARAAEVRRIHAIVDETGLTRDQIAAKQLAHNSIAGYDEDQLVARIYQQIQDVDARLEAFIPADVVEYFPDRVTLPHLDLELSYRTVLITFLPHQAEQFNRAAEKIFEQVDLDRDELYLVDRSLFEQWQAITTRLRKEYEARSLSTVIARLIDATAEVLGIEGRHPDDLDPDAYVPITELLGSAVLPPPLAAKLRAVVAHDLQQKRVAKSTRLNVLEAAIDAYAEREGIELPEEKRDV